MEGIRPIQETDLEDCSKLLEEAYSQEPYNEKFMEGSALEYVKEKFERGKEHSFIIELDGKIIGFVFSSLSHWTNGPQTIMEEIVVDKEFRGKGYSKKLNDFLESHFRKLGIKSSMLWVKKNSAANKFHLKNGYQDANDLTIMFKDF